MVMKPTSRSTRTPLSRGVTIIELVTAMTVTSFLAVSIFIAYTNLYHIFLRQTQQAERIREAIVVKTKMDALLRDIVFIEEAQSREIRYQRELEDSSHTLAFRDNSIFSDNILLAPRIGSLTLSLSAESDESGRRALRWDAVITGGRWIGGACIVAMREGRK
jgi:type II secretory pathway component PulJ